jgi:general stress protein YciG
MSATTYPLFSWRRVRWGFAQCVAAPFRNSALEETNMSDSDGHTKKGFALLDPARRRELAGMGGRASPSNFKNDAQRAADAGRKGGHASLGNFKNDPKRASEAGRKGGIAVHRIHDAPAGGGGADKATNDVD